MEKEKKDKVICKNCGAESYDIKGKCPNCGAYLYHFYQEERREAMLGIFLKFFLPLFFLALIIGGIFLYFNFMRDSVKEDLRNYLNNLKKTNTEFLSSKTRKEYQKKVLGFMDFERKEELESKFVKEGLSREKARMKAVKIANKEAQRIEKRTPMKEKFRIEKDYFSLKLSLFREIVPITKSVEKIHEHLLDSYELEFRANNLFYGQMRLGHFTNVYETKDGYVRWKFFKQYEKESNKYKKYSNEARKEEALFKKELAKLIRIKKLNKYYKKLFPVGFSP